MILTLDEEYKVMKLTSIKRDSYVDITDMVMIRLLMPMPWEDQNLL